MAIESTLDKKPIRLLKGASLWEGQDSGDIYLSSHYAPRRDSFDRPSTTYTVIHSNDHTRLGKVFNREYVQRGNGIRALPAGSIIALTQED